VKLRPPRPLDMSNAVREVLSIIDELQPSGSPKKVLSRDNSATDLVKNNSLVVDRPLPFKNATRRIFIVRHGERVDFTFGTWIPYCFNESGKYMRKDLNMPLTVPRRQGSPESFFKDSPMTCVGETQARFLGEAMKGVQQSVQHVYCSPSLRCVQTASNILKGLNVNDKVPIALEPGLFEWLAWYQDSMPKFMSPKELQEAGFLLREDHQHIVDFSELRDRKESSEQYYARSLYVIQCILRLTAHIGGNIMLVGHASTLDGCSRQLVGGAARNAQDFSRIVQRVPYCSLAVLQKTEASELNQLNQMTKSGGGSAMGVFGGRANKTQWELIEPPVPPMTLSANMRFDWQLLQS